MSPAELSHAPPAAAGWGRPRPASVVGFGRGSAY